MIASPDKGKSASKEVLEVWEHYQATISPTSKLDDKRKKLIARRLEHYMASDLKRCIDGYHVSPFHNGENADRKTYLGLELMLRDATHIEAGWTLRTAAIAPKPQPENRATKVYPTGPIDILAELERHDAARRA